MSLEAVKPSIDTTTKEEETPLCPSIPPGGEGPSASNAVLAPPRDVTPSPTGHGSFSFDEAKTTDPAESPAAVGLEALGGGSEFTPPPPASIPPVAWSLPATGTSPQAPPQATTMDMAFLASMTLPALQQTAVQCFGGAIHPAVVNDKSKLVGKLQAAMAQQNAIMMQSFPRAYGPVPSAAMLQATAMVQAFPNVAGMPGPAVAAATSTDLDDDRKPSAEESNLDSKPSAEEDDRALIAAEAFKLQCRDEIQVQKELDQMFETYSKKKYDGLPPYQQPEGFKDDVVLREHQQDGVRWLIHQEDNYDQRVSPFFKTRQMGKNKQNLWYVNSITNKFHQSPPVPDQGAILADDMGLGKSIQTLALMLSCMPKEDAPRATLLVAPVSVIAAWQFQITKFIEEGHLNVELYVGPKRQQLINRIKRKDDVDIVLTSYETLMSDWNNYQATKAEKEEAEAEKALAKKKAKKPRKDFVRDAWDGGDDDWAASSDSESDDEDDHYLPPSVTRKRKAPAKRPSTWIFELLFHRVVLDEAHKIRNSNTKFFKSCCAILANRRLAITGTPFVNKTDDIHSLLCFLNANNEHVSNPVIPKKQFSEYVTAPIIQNKLVGLSRIRMQMQHIALRRTKNKVDLGLPEKEIHLVSVPFSETGLHQEIHSTLYKTARECFLNLLAMDSRDMYRNFLEFFVLVLRVRQSCDSGSLISQGSFDRAKEALGMIQAAEEQGELRIDADEAKALLEKLLKVLKPPGQEAIAEECGICLEKFDEATAVALAGCSHVFCHDCVEKTMQSSGRHNTKCPLCRNPFKSNERISVERCKEIIKTKNAEEKNPEDEQPAAAEDGEEQQAPKITALLQKIDEMKSDEKGVIFSQWTSYLDIIAETLTENDISYCRIDGSMNAEARLESMQALEEDDGPRFCLISLMAGGVGITLNRANVCFMMDPWWNAAIQDQAIDRVHRIGQTRKVRVYQFAMKDSLEERMYRLQESKTALGNGSLRKLSSEEKKKARITALRDLFQVEKEDAVWKGWHEKERNDEEEDDDGSDLDGFIVADDDFS